MAAKMEEERRDYCGDRMADPLLTHMSGLLRLGGQRLLVREDVGAVRPEDASDMSFAVLSKYWSEELDLADKEKRSLARALQRSVGWWPIVTGAVLQGLACASAFASPMIQKGLLSHFSQDGDRLSPGTLWFLVGLMLFAPVFGGVCSQQASVMFSRVGIRIRSSLMSLSFQKALRLSPAARSAMSGTVNNVFSSDTEQLANFLVFLFPILYSPAQLAVGLALIYQEMGPSTFLALGWIVAILPAIAICGMGFGVGIKKKLAESDRRIKLTKELLNAIRIVKFYAWEKPLGKKLTAIRETELVYIREIFVAWIGISFCIESIAAVSPILIFALYSSTGNSLTYAKSFTTLSLFAIVTGASASLPGVFTHVSYALEAARRIQRLLGEEEKVEYVCRGGGSEAEADAAIILKNASFGWTTEAVADPASSTTKSPSTTPTEYQTLSSSDVTTDSAGIDCVLPTTEPPPPPSAITLKNLSLTIPKGALCGVVGAVGSGKSSFLSGLLNDCCCLSSEPGSVVVNGSVAYHSQTPFILSATLRENIIFGEKYDEAKMGQVLKRSALEQDLRALPGGIETEIGERGINLSGGQKARVSFARALYRQADITLLDDPLSAVDANTVDVLFRQGIKPMQAEGKTVVLVTHQTHLLSEMDLVIVLEKDGTLKACCPFAELASRGINIDNLGQDDAAATDAERAAARGDENEAAVEAAAATAAVAVSVSDVNPQQRPARARSSSAAAAAATAAAPASAKDDDKRGALTVEEERKEGLVTRDVYVYFAKAGGVGLCWLILLLCVATKACNLVATFVLAAWGAEVGGKTSQTTQLSYLGTYSYILLMGLCLVTLRTITASLHGVRGGYVFHKRLLSRVLRAPVAFFDVTPTGRVLNRFVGDLQLTDQGLSALIVVVVTLACDIIAAVCAISIATRGTFLVCLLPLSIVYWRLQHHYRATNLEVRRLLAISRSPVFVEISQTLAGVSCLAAYGRISEFVRRLEVKTDEFLALNFIKAKLNSWLNIRIDFLGALISFFVCCLAVATGGTFVPPEQLAIALTYSFLVPILLGVIFGMSAEIEGMLSAVERIKQYAEDIPVEEEEEGDEGEGEAGKNAPASSWPSKGGVEFKGVSMRYRDGPLVLNDLSFSVAGGDKVGIVGRTGSGKTSVIAALFRIVKPEAGTILVDGVDLSTLRLEDLRSRIAVVPQDPTLFASSLRFNLDPLEEHSDLELVQVLETVNLRSVLDSSPAGLLQEISEGGENLSLGERQLICFARALLRRPKLLVLDEATASVDNETDRFVQDMISSKFADCTILTIAHRLHTVIANDKILLLQSGTVAESGPPEQLIEAGGAFAQLWATYKTAHE